MNTESKPLVSAVILCYNRKKSIETTLNVLSGERYKDLEVIVVDNASTDGSPELVEERFPSVKLIRFHENTGIYAVNVGFETAKGKYILILDDDSYPVEDCITKSVDLLEKNKDIGIITAQIVNPGGGTQWPEEDIDKERDTYCFIGCGAVIRKDLFKKTGYYPNDYFLFHNELTTSLKALNLGYKIRYSPDIKCFHESPPTQRMNNRRIYFLVRNGTWNIWQFAPLRHLIYYYPGFLLRNLVLAVRYNSISGYFKAIAASYAKFVKYAIKERQPCNSEAYIKRLQKNLKR